MVWVIVAGSTVTIETQYNAVIVTVFTAICLLNYMVHFNTNTFVTVTDTTSSSGIDHKLLFYRT